MTRRVLTHSTLVAAALAGFAACSSDSSMSSGATSVAMTAEMTQDTRQDAAESAALTLDELTANEVANGANLDVAHPAPAAGAAAALSVNCTGPDANGWFSCLGVTTAGLTITRQIRFWEGMNYGLAWDSAKTDSVNHMWTAVGTVNSTNRPGKVWTINDGAHATMKDIRPPAPAPPQHSWSGRGMRDEKSTYTVNNVERDFTHTANDTVDVVVFQVPRSANPFPLSGSITRDVTSVFTAGSFTKTITRHIVVTFNGTRVAQLADGGVTCDLDLVTRTVSNCH